MATSGSYGMNGGGWNSTFSWWLNGQNIGGNYSNLGWAWDANWSGNSYVISSQAALWIDGREVHRNGYNTGRQMWGGRQASGSIDIGHNGDGGRSFGANGEAAFYTNAINARGSGSWGLPTIPRHASITNCSGNINDEATNPWVEFSNPAGTAVHVWLELPSLGGGNLARRNNVGSRYTWTLTEAEKNQIRSLMKNVKSTTLRYVIYDNLGGENWSFLDRTITIVNGEPTFTDFTYKDANPATVAITGSDQYIIQGYSSLVATIAAVSKAVAKKSATMSQYVATIGGESRTAAYSENSIDINFGSTNIAAGGVLSISAKDSRANQTTVNKNVSVVPYTPPSVIASGTRLNNFEAQTTIHIEGSIALLQVGGVTKNAVVAASGVKYRYREQGAAVWGAWTNRASTTGANGIVGTVDFVMSLDNSKEYEFEAQITDKITTTTVAFTVNVGIPIMRIGTDGYVYNEEQPVMRTHIGQIIMSATLDTAAKVKKEYGGMWVAWGVGRVPVGFAPGDADFGTIEAIGGAKTVTLTREQSGWWETGRETSGYGLVSASSFANRIAVTTSVINAHNNLQPSQVAYFWKRTN